MSETKGNAARLDTDGNVIVNPKDRRRLQAEDEATEAVYMLSLLGDLVDSARGGELELTAESTQGMCLLLARAQGAIRNLLNVLEAERNEAGE